MGFRGSEVQVLSPRPEYLLKSCLYHHKNKVATPQLGPLVSIPVREAWIYQNPQVLKSIRQGLAEAKQEKTEKVENLEEFLEDL